MNRNPSGNIMVLLRVNSVCVWLSESILIVCNSLSMAKATKSGQRNFRIFAIHSKDLKSIEYRSLLSNKSIVVVVSDQKISWSFFTDHAFFPKK